jgi:hypothetical protein
MFCRTRSSHLQKGLFADIVDYQIELIAGKDTRSLDIPLHAKKAWIDNLANPLKINRCMVRTIPECINSCPKLRPCCKTIL